MVVVASVFGHESRLIGTEQFRAERALDFWPREQLSARLHVGDAQS